MQRERPGSQKGKLYARRDQSECVKSMFKRNLRDHLRGRSLASRNRELMLKVLTHHLMIIRRRKRGSRRAGRFRIL